MTSVTFVKDLLGRRACVARREAGEPDPDEPPLIADRPG